MKTKKEIKELLEAGKLENLKKYIITDGTKKDEIDALYLLFKQESDEYNITFESVPYSNGGKYARHTSTLHSTQKWEVVEFGNSGFCIEKTSTSKSGACPDVIVPKFYTEVGKNWHNSLIENKIKELQKRTIKITHH